MKLWIDDVRPAPEGYVWAKSVSKAKSVIAKLEYQNEKEQKEFWGLRPVPDLLEVIDIDHDAGDYASDGGDYIKLLDWLEATGRNYPIHIHSMNVVGRQNMLAICERNGWKVIP
jgi:hypothetical protein